MLYCLPEFLAFFFFFLLVGQSTFVNSVFKGAISASPNIIFTGKFIFFCNLI